MVNMQGKTIRFLVPTVRSKRGVQETRRGLIVLCGLLFVALMGPVSARINCHLHQVLFSLLFLVVLHDILTHIVYELTANNGEIKERMLLQRSGEVVNSSGGHSLENG